MESFMQIMTWEIVQVCFEYTKLKRQASRGDKSYFTTKFKCVGTISNSIILTFVAVHSFDGLNIIVSVHIEKRLVRSAKVKNLHKISYCINLLLKLIMLEKTNDAFWREPRIDLPSLSALPPQQVDAPHVMQIIIYYCTHCHPTIEPSCGR